MATHKSYRMPTDPMYLPMHVGKALHPDVDLGFAGDDTGDNISLKNSWYSELTGLYWLWKNMDAAYLGLVHYRRHFETRNMTTRFTSSDRFRRIVSGDEVRALLREHQIILPKRRHYVVETIRSHYEHTLDVRQLDETRKILTDMCPEYVEAFDHVMAARSAHIFNMFIMSKGRLTEYCSWLFPVLFELERRIPPDSYDAFGARYPGRVSERLMDVWIITNGYPYVEQPVISPEPVNWVEKGGSFLLAKAGIKKYGKSF
ncbi:DUF4422 domain-containing protein [Bifidobacterium mongoliense]